MKETQKLTKTIEHEVVTKRTCDFCGVDMLNIKKSQKIDDMESIYLFDNGGDAPMIEATVKISMENGWPEGGEKKTISLDVCNKCFKIEIIDRAKQVNEEITDW